MTKRIVLGVACTVFTLWAASLLHAQESTVPPETPAVSPTQELERWQAEVETELGSIRAQLAALPDDVPGDMRQALQAEVDRLQRLELLHAGTLAILGQVPESETLKTQLVEDLARMRTAGPEGPRPFTFLGLDEARKEYELQQRRVDSREAATLTTQATLTADRESLADAERTLRRVREQLQTEDDPSATLEREHRLVELDARAAAATVRLHEQELAQQQLALAAARIRADTLSEKVRWYVQEARFTDRELAQVQSEIQIRESAIRQRQVELRLATTAIESELVAARGERHTLTGAASERLEAARLARDANQRELTLLGQALQREIDARSLWQCRFRASRHEAATGDRDRWIADSRAAIATLDRQLRLHRQRVEELRGDLTGLPEIDSDAAAEAWREQRRQKIALLIALEEQAIDDVERHRRLHTYLLAELEQRGVTFGDRLAGAWKKLGDVWRYEVVPVEGNPITVGKIVLGVLLLLLGWTLSRRLSVLFGRRLLPRLRMNEGVAAATQSILFYVFLLTFLLFALRLLNIPLTVFTVLGGAFAIGFGFGSQNIIKNFISGLILLAERPIRVGDLIQIADLYARVEHIGARSTRVRTGDNVEILVPNSSFLESNVVNWTLSDKSVRIKVTVGVAYGSAPREVTRLLRKVVEEHGRVAEKPTPIVLFSDFGSDSLVFEVHFWIEMQSLMERRVIESDIRHRIEHLFRDAGIVIAFPQRDVHIDSARPLEVRLVAPEPEVPSSTAEPPQTNPAGPEPGTGGGRS